MKTIGLIGGMSWESTALYYQMLNRMARERLGGLRSAEILMWSFDFAEIEALQAKGAWDEATDAMIAAARRLERGGAACLVICTNTMHKTAGAVADATSIPLLHIADATAAAVRAAGARRPLLLATRYTMEQDFYLGRLRQSHDVAAVTPDADGRAIVHRVIYDELCQGVIAPASKAQYLDIIAAAQAEGADGVILGCTEVGLLIGAEDVSLPVFDSTALHAKAALDFALSA